jgi:DNA-binding MarR family transcriptional regulator
LRAYDAMLRLHHRLYRIRYMAREETGLSPSDTRIVRVAQERPDLCISRIAARLDLSRQAVHRSVHRLVRAKILTVRRVAMPGRPLLVRVFPENAACVDAAASWERRFAGALLSPRLTRDDLDEIAAFGGALRRRLPWSVASIEALADADFSRPAPWSWLDEDECAIPEAVSR